ncbi:prepilin peptidase [Candidatus Marinarcus aquaticus]|nr:A24 family peptidase [Candidatus Marinarcus aquaticus]
MEYEALIIAFIVGACMGSFLNVLIVRLPLNLSILTSSNCPSCHTKIRWYENIPFISFVFLRGHCSSCHTKISWQYPMVEALTALVTTLLFYKLQFGIEFLVVTALFYALIVLSGIDIKYQAVPDYLLLFVLVLVFFLPSRSFIEQLKDALLFAGGFSLLNFIVTFYIQNIKSRLLKDEKLKKQTALGEGDIPIVALISALLGTFSGFVALFFAALFAIIPSLYFTLVKKQRQLAFIPFLSLGLFIEYIFSFSKVFS